MATVFHFYSLGLVAENKPRNDVGVNVSPIETMPAFNGEVTFNPQTQVVEGTDIDGKAYSIKSTQDATLPCTWLPAGANRVLPPDVRRGMKVEIWRLGDTDQYYWRYLGLDDHLMTLETVIYAFSANPAAGGSKVDINNCYYFEVSTHEKLVTFSTSKANGEPYRYTFQLNTKAGEFIFTDDIGTLIEMASAEGQVRLANADGTSVEINRQKIALVANEEFSVTVGGSKLIVNPSTIGGTAAAYDFE